MIWRVVRNLLYLISLGLAVHLVLPHLPGIERSATLVLESSPLLILTALLAYLLSQASYAELLGRAAGAAAGSGTSRRARRWRGLGMWFTLRVALCEHGAAHVLPGGGSASAAVTYGALRSRRLEPRRAALTVALVSALIYGTLGILCTASLLYLLWHRDLTGIPALAAAAAATIPPLTFGGAYLAYRRPKLVRRVLAGMIYLALSAFWRSKARRWAELRSTRLVLRLQSELRAVRIELTDHPLKTMGLAVLALGYWLLDVLCLLIIFTAFGVPFGGVELLVAYGIASTAGALPVTPGGIGVFETAALALLALLGSGPEAAIPILGYRLINFWLPIPLAAILYPTLAIGSPPSNTGR